MLAVKTILELPEEMILECCKNMDFQTRVNFKKTCKFMNGFLPNAKSFVTDEQVQKWQEKVKLMMGFGLLASLMEYKKIDLSKTFEEKIYMDYDEAKQSVLFSTTVSAMSTWLNIVKNNPQYEMIQDGYYIRGQGSLYGQFKLVKEDKSFTLTSKFLYDLYLGAICEWQHKNKNKVTLQQISQCVKLCFEKPFISFDIHQSFIRSQYLNIPLVNLIGDKTRNEIESLRDELMKEMKSYFLDGQEAYQFMNTCNLIQ